MKYNNIILIGMPGAGKSTIGVILAKSIGFNFCDTDLLIQQKTGKCLQSIINEDGIDSFLKLENEILEKLACENTVVATGGSAVFSENGMKNIKSNGIIIYLDVPISEIKRRVNNITTRGIAMKDGDSLESIYTERLPLYQKYADVTIPFDNTEKTVENIINTLNNKNLSY